MSERNFNGKTVLVVDDDEDFLAQQQLHLQAAGFTVVTAGDEEEAQRALDARPDLCVLDLMMEHTDSGFTLCHRIKQRYPDVPVVIITAVTAETGLEFDSYTAEERSWVKADAMLAKPVRFEQLLREIERLLPE
jgi:CheY-like chemotaxis protein